MELPARFGRYELLERVGAGGMAEVFLARSFGIEGFEKRLVIKRIRPGMAESPRLLSLFVQEAKITAGLDHPNVVQIFGLGRAQGCPYIAMEYIAGRTLSQIRKASSGPLDIDLAVYIMSSVLRGLAYAHAMTDGHGRRLGLVHRDVSPHNVIVGFNGEVKVLDFGIARIVGEEPAEGGQPGRDGNPGAGKIAYMSPEQALGQTIDHRSDIYSAGVVLIELVLGRRIFEDADPDEKLRRVRLADVPDPRVENPAVPEALWQIIQAMVARDPKDRPGRAELVAEDLQAFLYSRAARVGPEELATRMAAYFPSLAARVPAVHVDLDGLAEDLMRLEMTADGTDPSVQFHSVETWRPEGTSTGNSALPRPPGERKPVVAVAIELRGLTEVDERARPDDLRRQSRRLMRRVRAVVGRYGGQFPPGDPERPLAFFGLGRTSEHDLQRALGCARRMQELAESEHGPWALGVGVHRGELTVGEGSGTGPVFRAHGDTVKLAWRLCMLAEPGEVLVSEQVRAEADERYRMAPGPEVPWREARLRPSHRLLGHRAGLDATGGRWLRRGIELETIRHAMARLAEGRGGLLSVVGPTGTGKTHLLRDLRTRAQARGVPLIAGHALPYGGDRPLAAFRDLVLGVLGLEPDADSRDRRRAIKELARLGLPKEDRALLAELFTGADPVPGRIERDAERRALSALVAAMAQVRPLILAIEDIHCLEHAERALLRGLIEDAQHLAVLFIVTGRGAPPADLGELSWAVELGPLDAGGLKRLVALQLGASTVDEELSRRLSDAGEGNPLYTTSLCAHVLRTGQVEVLDGHARLAVTGALSVPPSLLGLLSARVDGLEAGPREALQLAAVLGPRFVERTFREVAEGLGVDSHFDELVQQGFLRGVDGPVHALASPLLWEVLGRDMSPRQARKLHGAVADHLTRRDRGTGAEGRDEIARHLAGAGRFLDAARMAEAEGDRLRDAELLDQAVRTWERGIGWAEQAEDLGRLGLEASLRGKAGSALLLCGAIERSEHQLLLALDLVSEMVLPECEARCHLALGRVYRARGRSTLARLHLEAALDCTGPEAATLPPQEEWRRRVAVGAHESLGLLSLDGDQLPLARRHLEAARQRAGQDARLASMALLGMGVLHIQRREPDQAITLLQAGLVHARAAGDRILAGRAINNIGIVRHLQGDHRRALERFRESLELRRGLGYRRGVAVNLHNIGESHFRLGHMDRAGSAFGESLALSKELRWRQGEVLNGTFLAYLELRRSSEGERQARLVALGEMVTAAEELGELAPLLAAWWLRARGLAEQGSHDEAAGLAHQGLARADEAGLHDIAADFRAVLEGVGQA